MRTGNTVLIRCSRCLRLQIKFGRWGGEIKNSRVVPEGELKWLAARAVQAEERSEVAAGFDARVSLMSVQVGVMPPGSWVSLSVCRFACDDVQIHLEVETNAGNRQDCRHV